MTADIASATAHAGCNKAGGISALCHLSSGGLGFEDIGSGEGRWLLSLPRTQLFSAGYGASVGVLLASTLISGLAPRKGMPR